VVLKQVSLLLVGIAIMEACSRLIYRSAERIPQISGGVQFVEFLRGKGENFTGPIETRPYGLYWNRPNYFRKGFQQTDASGFRYKGYDVTPGKSKTRILCYGGSTTYSDHVLHNPRECWPHMLEEKFHNAGTVVEVINCGLNYGLTSELITHLIFEGLHFNPDIVILHGPGNDTLPIAIGDFSFGYRKTRRSLNITPRFFEPALLKVSGLMRLIYARALRETVLVELEPKTWPATEIQNHRLINSTMDTFQSNVRTFVDICLSRGIKVILVDFVQNHPNELERYRPGLSTGMVESVSKMNRFFADLAQSDPRHMLHVDFLPNSFDIADFVDLCHLNLEGEIKKAELIFSATHEFVVMNQSSI
jgi:hypothetical protein